MTIAHSRHNLLKMPISIITTLLAILLTHDVSGQALHKDSVQAGIKERLMFERDSLKRVFRQMDCTDFLPHENPTWSDTRLIAKTYYQNCTWGGTYVVINNDSTFLYKRNSEGPGNYLEKGRWEIKGDSVLILRGSGKLTEKFMDEMKIFDETRYKADLSTRYLLFKDDKLVLTGSF